MKDRKDRKSVCQTIRVEAKREGSGSKVNMEEKMRDRQCHTNFPPLCVPQVIGTLQAIDSTVHKDSTLI